MALRGVAGDPLAGALGLLLEEQPRQQGDVAGPLAERRDPDRVDHEVVEQVAGEILLVVGAGEVVLRGDDHPHVRLPDARRVLAVVFAPLDEALQLHLHRHRQRLDVVEEDRPPSGLLDEPRRLLPHAAPVPGLPEEERREPVGVLAVRLDGDERPGAARARLVDGAGDRLLAGAALPPDEDAHVARGEPFRLVEQPDHPVVPRRERMEGGRVRQPLPRQLLRQLVDRPVQRPLLDRALEDLQQVLLVDGLREVVERAELHRAHGEIDVAHPGDDDDGRVVPLRAHGAQDVHAAHVRHVHVEQDGLERPAPEQPLDLARVVRDDGLVQPRLDEEDHEVIGDGDVVVDDEDLSHPRTFAEAWAGIRIVNVVPAPCRLRTEMFPPCSSRMR